MHTVPEAGSPGPVRSAAAVSHYYPREDGWGAPSPIAWPDFAAEVRALYRPPLRAKATAWRVGRVLDAVGELLGEGATTAGLTPALVARFVETRPKAQSPNTTFAEVAYLRAICSIAEAQRYIPASPFRLKRSYVKRVPASAERSRHHSRAEIARVIDRAALEASRKTGWARWRAQRTHALICLVAYTGLRRDEALRLRVEDVDLVDRVLLLVRREGRSFKTSASAQPVPIPLALAKVLDAWIPLARSEWLFPNCQHNGPWVGGSAGYRPLGRLKRVAKRAGVEGFTFLSLRHSFATHAEFWGLSEAMIMRVLRHTTVRTSREHYRHADITNMVAAVDGISFGEGR